MKNFVLSVLIFLVPLCASANSSFTLGNAESTAAPAAMKVFVAGPCRATVLENGDVVIFARKEAISHVMMTLGGQISQFWIDRSAATPIIKDDGPNLVGECKFPPSDKKKNESGGKSVILARK